MYEHKNYYEKWRSVTLQTDIFFCFKIYENTFLSQKKTTPYYSWLNCWTKAKIIKEQHFLLPVACLYTSHPLNFYENGQKDKISKEERNGKNCIKKSFFLMILFIHIYTCLRSTFWSCPVLLLHWRPSSRQPACPRTPSACAWSCSHTWTGRPASPIVNNGGAIVQSNVTVGLI